ncbi:uncharacterized protein F4822DRAFT_430689 [Hypoxylon trugodes]|uniref:uncharacterized protein n=1 Tax=Hypoxylon trugodes TaxID=326681 RepID=UPI00219919B4|nr:uncharacterized protein F4822DRAFT_430689 [Hypoxylon trugodes]KAI1387939.1 hypothetical protein F4822DRAFT_430689 [Hypoxylon trugodes]
MSMVGLEEVKAHFLAINTKVKAAKADNASDPDFQGLRFHLILHGRSGMGKKTVPSIYASFLHSLGVMKEYQVQWYSFDSAWGESPYWLREYGDDDDGGGWSPFENRTPPQKSRAES